MTKNTEHKSNTPANIKDLWRTPKYVFDYFDKRFNFNIDMAASNENHLCARYITKNEDALSYLTIDEELDQLGVDTGEDGSIWCNPPYSKLMPWVVKVVEYVEIFNIPFVMLLPADTSVKWFKLAFENCSECHFISGRLAFINEETLQPVAGNNKGSVVFVFDPKSPFKQHVSLIDRDEMRV